MQCMGDECLPRALELAKKKIQGMYSSYLRIFWNKEPYYTSEKLEPLLERLDDCFVFCHRSYLINLNTVTDLKKDFIILIKNIQVPVSKTRFQEVKRNLAHMLTK